MRIVETSLARATSVRRSGRVGANHDGFGELLDAGETEAPRSLASAAPLMSVAGLLALQTVEDPTQGRSRGLAHGEALLEELNALQRELALGGGSVARLQQIADKVRKRPADLRADPQLNGILDEIELRVAVELAKRECFV